MASRRRGPAADAFGGGEDSDLHRVDSVLYGGLQTAERDRIKRRAVLPGEIVIDPAIQVRVGGLDYQRVETLKQVLLNGGAFKDPIQVIDDGEQLLLADGLHRVEATVQTLADMRVVSGEIAIAPLQAEIRTGTFEDALNVSEEANLKHGAPLTNEDKKNLLFRRLTRGYYGSNTSNREIAQTLGVVHTTIGRWRQEWFGANAPGREKHEKPSKALNHKKREPNTRQLRQRTLKSLRLAVESMNKLELAETDEVLKFIEYLAQKWEMK